MIKVLKPVKKKKIKREIKILQNLASQHGADHNVLTLLDVVRDPRSKVPSLVTEYVPNADFFNVNNTGYDDFDGRYYVYELLRVSLRRLCLVRFSPGRRSR